MVFSFLVSAVVAFGLYTTTAERIDYESVSKVVAYGAVMTTIQFHFHAFEQIG